MTKFSQIELQSSFSKELPVDPNPQNFSRQVKNTCLSFVNSKLPIKPELVHLSYQLLKELDLEVDDKDELIQMLSGAKSFKGFNSYAMCYGGHQFGNWAGQLGDGRAINIAEVNIKETNWKFQLKGSGPTPYSRNSDGLAVLRSSIREYLCSEAMFHLGVPTTRALSLSLSGDKVLRDVLYNGNPDYEKGAIVSRVAPSFLRFGSYEIFSARGDKKTLKTLVDYTIKHHFPHLGKPSKDVYVAFLKEVANRSLEMVIHWQRVGFVHGVMNTDNMSILGLTIDYGPYGWLEGYDPNWTPNTTDNTHKRYRYGTQPQIVLWNLFQLANALFPLVEEAKPLETILKEYRDDLDIEYLKMMRSKLGFMSENKTDRILIEELEKNLQLSETDMTIFFRNLANLKKLEAKDWLKVIGKSFYEPIEIADNIRLKWADWFAKYAERLQSEETTDEERKAKMNTVNPKYVLRNYMAQIAIDNADNGDYSTIDELYQLLKKPYDEQPDNKKWFAKRPEWARHKVGCSMLSCSS